MTSAPPVFLYALASLCITVASLPGGDLTFGPVTPNPHSFNPSLGDKA
jgi:hypothetical protein